MPKFSKGDKVGNSTLSVLDYVSNSRIRCVCSECGKGDNDDYVSMVYNESELSSSNVQCRFCAEIKKAKANGVYTEKEIYMNLLAKSSATSILSDRTGTRCVITNIVDLGNSKFSDQYPLGEKFGDLVSIAYVSTIKRKDEYGLHYTVPTHIVLKCENCGYITFIEVNKLRSINHVCPLCFNLKNQMQLKLKQREEQSIRRDIAKSHERDFQSVRTEFSKLSTNKSMQKNVSTLESKNPDYKVVDITKDGGATTYHLVCKKCGSVVTCMRSNARVEDCSFCKAREENKDFSKMGYLYKNYVGSVFNGLKIVSQTGFTCEVECLKCGKRRSNLDLNGVLSKRHYCDCERSKISIECPYCYAPTPSITYGDIYSGKLPCCPSCKKVINESEYLIAIESVDYGDSLRSKLKLANSSISDKAIKKIQFGNKFAVDSLIVEKDPVYKGNDAKAYYRCFCKKHNIGLVLSEDELKKYDCEFCDDTRQKIIANPDSDSIKLN